MADYASELSELLPESSGDGSKGIGINVRRLLKMRARYMVAALLLIVVPAAVLIWMKVPTTFTATGRIEFKSNKQELLAVKAPGESYRQYREYVLTQMEILTGYSTMSAVMEDEEISMLPSIAETDGPYAYLMGNVEVAEEVSTNLVTLSFTSSSRDDAIRIANAISDTYVMEAAERAKSAGGEELAVSKQVRDNLVEAIATEGKKQKDLAAELQVTLTGISGNDDATATVTRESYVNAENEYLSAESRKRAIDASVQRAEGYLKAHEKDIFKAVLYNDIESQIEKFQEIALQNETVSLLQRNYTTARESLREGTPRLRALATELQLAKDDLQEMRARYRGQLLESNLDGLRQDLTACDADMESADRRRQALLAMIADDREAIIELDQRNTEIQIMAEQIDAKKLSLAKIRERIDILEANAVAPVRAVVAEQASAPEAPNYKDRIKFIILATMFGTTVAAGLGIMLEVLDQNIRSAQDIGYISDLPVLATIPHSKEEKFPRKTDMATITSTHPNSMTADQFRQTVARLLHSERRGHEFKTCAVVSPVNGDGKTTLAANLAIALAQADRKTLLIDIDSRNPNIEAAFGLEPASGLSEMLSRDKLARDPDRRTEFENLYILGPGLQSNNLVERLASKEMKDFLQGSSRLFDNIIIDTPSVLIASESKLIAPLVDGVIVVAGAGKLTFGKLQRGIRVMEECGARIIGVVVNGVRHTSGGYLRENIKAYYKHSGGKRHQLPKGKNGNGHRKPVEKPVETVTVPAQNSDEEL